MRSTVYFTAASGTEYDIIVEHEPNQYTPLRVEERQDGVIYDPGLVREWPSLIEMSHALKITVVSFASDSYS
jgi:hypothetical protein